MTSRQVWVDSVYPTELVPATAARRTVHGLAIHNPNATAQDVRVVVRSATGDTRLLQRSLAADGTARVDEYEQPADAATYLELDASVASDIEVLAWWTDA